MSPQPLDIHLLGPLEVLKEEERLDLPPSRKARALLAYLVTTGRPHARSALCDLFWDDVRDPRAGLRWGLSKVRTVLEGEADGGGCRRIVTSRDRVGFRAEEVQVDLHHVQTLVPADPSDVSTGDLRTAALLFRGDFLEGLELPGCHQYQAWCLGTRERLRSLHVSIHATLAERLRAADPEAALPHALTRLTLDPFVEEAYVDAMELLGELGRIRRGLELYERCKKMMAEYLRVSPSSALEEARRRLTARSQPVASRPVASQLLAELREAEAQASAAPQDPPLVGRHPERERLAALLEEVRSTGSARVVLLTGEPGIGKSRLLREVMREARSRGGWILSGRAFDTEEVRPYGPWSDLLSALPAEGLHPELRNGLAGLLPGSDPEGGGGPTERAQLFDAIARLLRRLAAEGSPGLIVLDDVHWLDEASAALLHYVTRTLDGSPLLFACAAREEEIEPGSSVARLVRALKGSGRLHRMPLGRLDPAETGSLVAAIDDALDPARIFAASEGNPLFSLEIARFLHEGGDQIPSSIEEELADRLEALDPNARSLLPWAAALGQRFALPTLVRAVDRPASEIVGAIDTLERRGILRATGTDRYEFSHSLLHRAAYRRLSEPTRRTVHRSIAGALDRVDQAQGRAPGAVAHHAERGGLPDLAARAYLEAAESSLWIFAFDEAAELTERGLAQVRKLAEEVRIPLELDLLCVYSRLSMRDRRPAELEARIRRLTEEARAVGLAEVVATGHFHLAALQYQRGAFEETRRSSVRAAEAGRHSDPRTAARVLGDAASCLLLVDRDLERARRLTAEAETLAAEHGLEIVEVVLARALLHHHDGELTEAAEALEEVVRLGRRAQDRWWECPALTRRVLVDLQAGDWQSAAARAREAERLGERLEDEPEAAFARGLRAVAAASASVDGPDDDGEGAGDGDGAGEGAGEGAGGLKPVDDALRELRTLDSLWKIAQLQAYATEVDLARERPAAARERAEEILRAAEALARPNLRALARSLLARSAALGGEYEEAERHLEAPEVARPTPPLSSQARGAVQRARVAIRRVERGRSDVPTLATTPVPTEET